MRLNYTPSSKSCSERAGLGSTNSNMQRFIFEPLRGNIVDEPHQTNMTVSNSDFQRQKCPYTYPLTMIGLQRYTSVETLIFAWHGLLFFDWFSPTWLLFWLPSKRRYCIVCGIQRWIASPCAWTSMLWPFFLSFFLNNPFLVVVFLSTMQGDKKRPHCTNCMRARLD